MEAEKLAEKRRAIQLKHDATVMVQCAIRQKLARKAAKARKSKKRKEVGFLPVHFLSISSCLLPDLRSEIPLLTLTQEEERKRNEQLERELESLHKAQEEYLFAVRMQCCIRKWIAGIRVQKQREKRAEEARQKLQKKKNFAASRIQARARGISVRQRIRDNKDELKAKQRAARSVSRKKKAMMAQLQELEAQEQFIEKYGTTPGLLRGLPEDSSQDYIFNESANYSARGYGGGYDQGYVQSQGYVQGGFDEHQGYDQSQEYQGEYYTAGDGSEWQEYYDGSAQSTYWYNLATGETLWSKPDF